eukprot:Gb_24325 [translate_table: standard]
MFFRKPVLYWRHWHAYLNQRTWVKMILLRTAARELFPSAPRLQKLFLSPTPKPYFIQFTHKFLNISVPKLGFGRLYYRHTFALPFASKAQLSQHLEVFAVDGNSKRNSLLYRARAATVGLQENWTDADENSDGFHQMNEEVDTHFKGWDENAPERIGFEAKLNVNIEQQCDVKDVEEYSDEWRRRIVAWLCKELPGHDPARLIRTLNRQRKWIQPQDAKYIIIHLLQISESITSHRVYKWMSQQHWYEFDLTLVTKLADFLGKDLQVARCRDMFDEIINRGQVPCDSTFVTLIMAYIKAPVQGSVHKAVDIFNSMIQLGGYQPSFSLQNSLFKAFLSSTAEFAKHNLKQAEALFQNMKTAGCRINRDIYEGLIWLHSYQDCMNCERITFLRKEMLEAGLEESRGLLISILRVCSREGDVHEAERIWVKLLETGIDLTSQIFVYRMEVYAKAGEPMRSLDVFRQMQEKGLPMSIIAYQKIIEVMSKAQEKEYAEYFLKQFEDSGMKTLQSSYVDLMQMYLGLSMYDDVDSIFSRCKTKCRPNQPAYNVYLESLIQSCKLERAEEVFAGLQKDGSVGVNAQTYNIMLEGYLTAGKEAKIQRVYDEMCHRKYEVEPRLMQQIKPFISLDKADVNRHLSLKLIVEQRQILIGMLLSGSRIESHDENKTFEVHFEINQKMGFQNILKMHLHEIFLEWLKPTDQLSIKAEEIPHQFSTVSHNGFKFYADQFRSEGKPVIPRLIHRWLSPRVLAYWYMYGGHKSTNGDIVLNAQNYRPEDVERIMKALKAISVTCFTERSGKHFQLRCHGRDAMWLWKLMETYILDELKEVLKPDNRVIEEVAEINDTGLDSETEFNEENTESEGGSDRRGDQVV